MIQAMLKLAPEHCSTASVISMMLQLDKPDDFVIAARKTCALKDFVQLVFEKLRVNGESVPGIKTLLKVNSLTVPSRENVNHLSFRRIPDLSPGHAPESRSR